MTSFRVDSVARRSAMAVVEAVAFGRTHAVTATVSHRLGMRPFTNSKRKTNRFPV